MSKKGEQMILYCIFVTYLAIMAPWKSHDHDALEQSHDHVCSPAHVQCDWLLLYDRVRHSKHDGRVRGYLLYVFPLIINLEQRLQQIHWTTLLKNNMKNNMKTLLDYKCNRYSTATDQIFNEWYNTWDSRETSGSLISDVQLWITLNSIAQGDICLSIIIIIII